MEKYKVRLSIVAKNDFKSIISYIKNDLLEPTIARKYAELIKEEIKTLEHFPQKFSVIDPSIIKYDNFRKLIIKNYIAFYRINEDKKTVNIERILYGGTDWKNKL